MRAVRVHAERTAERPHPGRKHGGNFQYKEDTHRAPSTRRTRRFFARRGAKMNPDAGSRSGGD